MGRHSGAPGEGPADYRGVEEEPAEADALCGGNRRRRGTCLAERPHAKEGDSRETGRFSEAVGVGGPVDAARDAAGCEVKGTPAWGRRSVFVVCLATCRKTKKRHPASFVFAAKPRVPKGKTT